MSVERGEVDLDLSYSDTTVTLLVLERVEVVAVDRGSISLILFVFVAANVCFVPGPGEWVEVNNAAW